MKKLPCKICGKAGRYRYAPHDFPFNWTEEERWRCQDHCPYDATQEGWNGEWDDYDQPYMN